MKKMRRLFIWELNQSLIPGNLVCLCWKPFDGGWASTAASCDSRWMDSCVRRCVSCRPLLLKSFSSALQEASGTVKKKQTSPHKCSCDAFQMCCKKFAREGKSAQHNMLMSCNIWARVCAYSWGLVQGRWKECVRIPVPRLDLFWAALLVWICQRWQSGLQICCFAPSVFAKKKKILWFLYEQS